MKYYEDDCPYGGKWVINDAGDVAMHYVITTNDHNYGPYNFHSITNVNMCWVPPNVVSGMLQTMEKSCNCNNGTMKNAYRCASLANVNIYYTGSQ